MYNLVKIGHAKFTIDMGENIVGNVEHVKGVMWQAKIGDYHHSSTSRRKAVEGCIKKIVVIHSNLINSK